MSSPSLAKRTATAGASHRSGHHDALARQVRRNGLREGFLRAKAAMLVVLATTTLGGDFIFGGRGFEFLQLQLKLVEQACAALGALAEAIPVELLDLQLEVGDQCFGAGDLRPRGDQFLLSRQQQSLQALGIVRQGIDRRHGGDTRA